MKKLKYLLLLLLVVPMIAKADVNAVTGVSIEEGKEVDSSSAIFGNEITSNNTTKGIEALFGYDINFNGTSDYALVLGNNININGTVNNDAFVFGGVVNINDKAYPDMVNILRNEGYGVTVIDVEGKNTDEEKDMLFIEINNKSFNHLQKIVKQIDHDAFIVVNETKYVMNGFLENIVK